MITRKIIAGAILFAALLGTIYLFSGKPFTQFDAAQLSVTPLPCSGKPVITGLASAQDPQVRRLAAYQLLCQSAAITTLVVPSSAKVPEEFVKFGLRSLQIPDVDNPQLVEVNNMLWLPAATHKTATPAKRSQALQQVTIQAEALTKQGTHVGIYVVADGDRTYFNGSESVLRDFITRWLKDGLPVALYDRG